MKNLKRGEDTTKQQCYVIDFDGTLAYFPKGFGGLFAIYLRRGVPEKVVKGCYLETKQRGGFSFPLFRSIIEERVGGPLRDCATILSECDRWLEQELAVFAESRAALEGWQKQWVRVVILTAGEQRFQQQKLRAVGLTVDEVLIVPTDQEKPGAVRGLLERGNFTLPLRLIDDKPDVLDLIHTHFLPETVETVWICRPGSPYASVQPEYNHRRIVDLREL